MFSFFKKKPICKRETDKTFLTKAAKLSNLRKDIQNEFAKSKYVILLGFFKKSQEEIKQELSTAGIPFTEIREGDVLMGMQLKPLLLVQPFFFDRVFELNQWLQAQALGRIKIFFAEHYPLYQTEQNLLKKLEEMQPAPELIFYNALEEPLYTFFGGDQITRLIKTLGLKEDEALSHSLIDKSLVNAQKKLEAKVKMETKADSQQDWFQYNL